MEPQKMFSKFTTTLDVWGNALPHYTEAQLRQRPDPESWSIGQVYVHLTEGTLQFHLRQVETCLATPANQKQSKTFPGKMAYLLGQFPPIRIKVPPSPEYTPHQPASKVQLAERLTLLRQRMRETAEKLQAGGKGGKTKHPAFGYLDARDWYRLIDMHFRHHLRQKKRIDQFLAQTVTA